MRDNIKTVLASYLKGDITSIDEAVDRVIGCLHQLETADAAYAQGKPAAYRWFYNGTWYFGPRPAPQGYPSEPLFVRQQYPAESLLETGSLQEWKDVVSRQAKDIAKLQSKIEAMKAQDATAGGPVAYITSHGFNNWMAGSGPEQHVLLRGPDGNMPRVPLYAAPVAYVVFADDGEAENIRIWWWNNRERAEEFASAKNVKLIPLYRDPK